ncbi:hypothetical protein ABN27_00725 [Haemophilus influenzae]|nr:hypothetical protein ABN27_00725 [Haemophilus influenzae]PRJ51290.1 Xanthine phosphoribosyltransferase [Haemophilus influenzae]PRK88503.1 Xanthine phosphoribosyltransferase [Haemophilus influenzae]PRK91303.1 Xanthine phosphoribosyltransferase [Haemophilus influenzae]PRL39371.1 Xanthine phosphoribosyltransferase [Haemophilus influenzae]
MGNSQDFRFLTFNGYVSQNSRTATTVFAKPAGAELVDDYVIDIPQNTWIEQPWDLGLTFVPPLSRK